MFAVSMQMCFGFVTDEQRTADPIFNATLRGHARSSRDLGDGTLDPIVRRTRSRRDAEVSGYEPAVGKSEVYPTATAFSALACEISRETLDRCSRKRCAAFNCVGFARAYHAEISARCFGLSGLQPHRRINCATPSPNSPGTGSSQKSRHRRRMNIEKPCGVSRSFGPRCHHCHDFILLIGAKFWTATSDSPLLTGSIQSSLCSFAEDRSFELGKRADHLHHHAPRSSGRINRFRQTFKSGFSFLNAFHDHQ
jgi:hypothetical protein